MKNFFVLVFLLIAFSVNFAQEQQTRNEEAKTKLGKFSSKEGSILVKEFLDSQKLSGNVGTSIEIQAVKFYVPNDEKNASKGLRITLTGYKESTTVFLDLDEIESLLQAMDYVFQERDKLTSRPFYTEVIFSTKDDFEFGAYTKDKEMKLFAKAGKYPYTTFYADLDQLNTLRMITSNLLKILR